MNFIKGLILAITIVIASTVCVYAGQMWNPIQPGYNTYMNGMPNNNSNYYSPGYNQQFGNPNHDPDYYNRKYQYNGNYTNGYNDAPHGNDIRDYNPYFDRYGNRK